MQRNIHTQSGNSLRRLINVLTLKIRRQSHRLRTGRIANSHAITLLQSTRRRNRNHRVLRLSRLNTLSLGGQTKVLQLVHCVLQLATLIVNRVDGHLLLCSTGRSRLSRLHRRNGTRVRRNNRRRSARNRISRTATIIGGEDCPNTASDQHDCQKQSNPHPHVRATLSRRGNSSLHTTRSRTHGLRTRTRNRRRRRLRRETTTRTKTRSSRSANRLRRHIHRSHSDSTVVSILLSQELSQRRNSLHRCLQIAATNRIHRRSQSGRILRTLSRVLRQQAHNQRTSRSRDGLRKRRRRIIHLSQRNRNLRLTRKRTTTHQALITNNAQRVHIRRCGSSLTGCLLRRQILGGAHHLAGSRQRHLISQTSNTEISHLHAIIRGDDKVTRLHVTVHQTLRMSRSQRASGLSNEVQNTVRRQGSLVLDNARERITRHQLHDQVRGVVLLAVVENVRYTGVVQQRRITGLSAETLQEARVTGVLLLEDLDRNDASKHLVASFPHLAHTANRDTFG